MTTETKGKRGAARKSLKMIKDEVEYYPHQTEGVRHMARLSSFLLADEMGLGKSLQSLTVGAIDWERGWAERMLIVSPASLKWNWAAEIEEFTNFSYIIVDGTAAERKKQLEEFAKGNTDILVMNYEQVLSHQEMLNRLRFNIGIFDEAHYLKNRSAKRTKACHALKFDRVFLLTGSPILNNVQELWGLLHMIDPGRFPNYWRFVNRYAVWGGYKDKEVVGLKNVAELNMILGEYMIRRLKKDVLDLPEKQYITIRVDLSAGQRKLYNQAKEELRIELPDLPGAIPTEDMELDNALTRALRLKQVCGTTATIPGYDDDSAKLDAAIEKVKEIIHDEPDSPGEHVVVFTQFREVQRCFERRLDKLGIPWYELHGDVKKSERREVVDQWSAHPKPAVMVAMLQVAGVGLTMTKASKAIFIDKLWVPKLNEQAEDRIHRIGASESQPVQIISIIARNTIEQRVEQLLKRKTKTFNQIVEDTDWKKAMYEALREEEEDA